jgi:uncharacterized protein (DUF2141 family)
MKIKKQTVVNIFLPALLILIAFVLFTVIAARFTITPGKPEEGIHFEDKEGNIRVEATGFFNNQGSAIFFLANNQEFEESSTNVRSVKAQIRSGKAEAVFENIHYGEYVILALHDVNDNGNIDFNNHNVPEEPLGYSNKTGPITGPLNFMESKFALDKPEIDLQITMHSF